MGYIRQRLGRLAPLKTTYHALDRCARTSVFSISPSLLARLLFLFAWHRLPNLQAPRTFDEKLQWLNLYWRHPLKARCGDKFMLRGYVEEQGLEGVLARLYSVYKSADEVLLDALPERFVLKCSHGCKCNVFCADRRGFDLARAKSDLRRWMRRDYSRIFAELHYRDMTPRVICEEFLQDDSGLELPTDYKLFCFGGKVYCTMVGTARDPNGTPKIAFYDRLWARRLPYATRLIEADQEFSVPLGFEEMVDVAEKLSRPFSFVRMDFYSIAGKARLGEMTFTPGGCVSASYMTPVGQKELGELIRLPPRFAYVKPAGPGSKQLDL